MRRTAIGLLLCLAAATRGHSQSLAASLGGYAAVLRVPSVAGVSAKSFSGVAFHPETRTLYVIDNDNAVIYELNASGVLQRSIATSGFADPEGIAYQGADTFLIAEEGLANIVRIKLPRSGNGPVAKSGGAVLNLSPVNFANSGIEGVAYRPADKTVFAVKEIDPPRLYRIAIDGTGNPKTAFPNDPFNIEAKSGDAADIWALNDGGFILVDQEQGRLEGYGPDGQALSSLSLGMTKPEGIAVDNMDGTIYVVGEPLEFAVFRKKGAAISKPLAQPSATAGFACAYRPGTAAGQVPLLRYSLPVRSRVRIETVASDGKRLGLWRGTADAGPHEFHLPTTTRPVCYRFTAGSFRRSFSSAQ
jgi:uncharacterized protein YjiK